MIYGLDYLLAANYSKETQALCVKEHPQGWAIGVFSTLPEGGDARPFVESILKTGRCPAVRIHLMWKDAHNFSEADFPKIEAEAKKWSALISKYKDVAFSLSGACEHNLNKLLATKLKDRVLAAIANKANYVNTPLVGKGALIDSSLNVRNEFHGSDARITGANDANFSFDGSSAFDSDVATVKKNCFSGRVGTFFFWVPQFNMKKTAGEKKPRPQRKTTLSSELIDSVIYLSNDTGNVALSNKNIFKSHCEQTLDDTAKDIRGNRPVIIVPDKAPELQLVANNGQVVATAKYYGTFAGGGYRYYCSSFGYQIAEKAKRIQGSPVVKLMAGKKLIGLVNPAFRAGKFR